MPSRDRLQLAQEAVASGARAFGSALTRALEQSRAAAPRSGSGSPAEELEARLGSFAVGRIDPARFAALSSSGNGTCSAPSPLLGLAFETLESLSRERSTLLRVTVPTGADFGVHLAQACAEVGRVFGAARVIAHERSGRRQDEAAGARLEAFPFEAWNRAERQMAPPLVVEVAGQDLRAGALAPFLDGTMKLLLVVEGPCAPAPLVRLITPGTFVLQTPDGAGLDRFAAWHGCGVAALVPESAAAFVHDPAAGSAVWQRTTVTRLPEERPREPLGGLSVAQMNEELEQLVALSSPPSTTQGESAAKPAAAASDPAEKLAAWLLQQADLSASPGPSEGN